MRLLPSGSELESGTERISSSINTKIPDCSKPELDIYKCPHLRFLCEKHPSQRNFIKKPIATNFLPFCMISAAALL